MESAITNPQSTVVLDVIPNTASSFTSSSYHRHIVGCSIAEHLETAFACTDNYINIMFHAVHAFIFTSRAFWSITFHPIKPNIVKSDTMDKYINCSWISYEKEKDRLSTVIYTCCIWTHLDSSSFNLFGVCQTSYLTPPALSLQKNTSYRQYALLIRSRLLWSS